MTKDAKEIAKALDLIWSACGNIQDHDACDGCPLHYCCLNDYNESVIEIAELISASTWDEFLTYSDKAMFSEAELNACHADFMRKWAEEERMIEEYERNNG